MTFDAKKFISGFNLTNGEKVGKLLYYVLIISACLTVYYLITRPQQIQKIVVQKGGSAVIQQEQKTKSTWGVGGNIQSNKTVGITIMRFF